MTTNETGEKKINRIICKKCGANISHNDRYCKNCGYKNKIKWETLQIK